ncbi:MAG: AraC family transcriptional regulator, partial [bacterium]
SPALPAIGHSRQTAARYGLTAHTHPVFEICLIQQGSVDWFIEGRNITLAPGSVFLTRPMQRHGSRTGMIQPCSLAWLQVDPERLGERDLARELNAVTRTTWRDDGRLASLHEQMLRECRSPRADSPRMIRAMLVQLLTVLVRQARDVTDDQLPAPVQRALALIHQEPHVPWTLAALQRHVGVGRTRLNTLFRTHLGQSPGAYALRYRLRQAQLALRETDQSITDIATAFGFASSQHFATAFRKAFGITPRQCRAQPGL